VTGEVLWNPGRSAAPGAGPDRRHRGEPRRFHRGLPGYSTTPLVAAPVLASRFGLEHLWVKVESERLGLPAFKMLGASWAVFRVLSEALAAHGASLPDDASIDHLREAVESLGPVTLVAATDGNHGRAVARMAALLGCRGEIFVPAGTVRARIDAIAGEGAHGTSVTVVDGSYDDAVLASAVAGRGEGRFVISDTSWEGYHDVPRWVIEGYGTIFDEVAEQLAGTSPDVVVVQMGVGALAAATVAAFLDAPATIVVVEPVTAACGLRSAAAGRPVEVPGPHRSIMAGLNCGNVSPVAWPAVAARADVFVAVEDVDVEQAMRDLAGADVVAGETGAAGVAGLATLARDRQGADLLRGATALVLCTEGATDPEAYRRIVGVSPPGSV
jgi:diaminopropionate ammonia-lyase